VLAGLAARPRSIRRCKQRAVAVAAVVQRALAERLVQDQAVTRIALVALAAREQAYARVERVERARATLRATVSTEVHLVPRPLAVALAARDRLVRGPRDREAQAAAPVDQAAAALADRQV
jgi:hypothetical protein